jgi:hypothetical protein
MVLPQTAEGVQQDDLLIKISYSVKHSTPFLPMSIDFARTFTTLIVLFLCGISHPKCQLLINLPSDVLESEALTLLLLYHIFNLPCVIHTHILHGVRLSFLILYQLPHILAPTQYSSQLQLLLAILVLSTLKSLRMLLQYDSILVLCCFWDAVHTTWPLNQVASYLLYPLSPLTILHVQSAVHTSNRSISLTY